jgi:hypothetical protein
VFFVSQKVPSVFKAQIYRVRVQVTKNFINDISKQKKTKKKLKFTCKTNPLFRHLEANKQTFESAFHFYTSEKMGTRKF